MKYFILDEEKRARLATYLSRCPYAEVFQLIDILTSLHEYKPQPVVAQEPNLKEVK